MQFGRALVHNVPATRSINMVESLYLNKTAAVHVAGLPTKSPDAHPEQIALVNAQHGIQGAYQMRPNRNLWLAR